MSTAAVSSSSLYQQLQTYFHTRSSDVQQLGQALKSGDLAGAQQAFNAISQLGQNGPFASGDAFRVSQREQAFNNIGQALQSGDLAGAQAAFAALQATGASRTQGGAAAGSTGPEPPVVTINLSSGGAATSATGAAPSGTVPATSTTAAPPASSSTATGPEIVINLGAGSGPEQITLNLTNQSNGGEQLTIGVGSQQGGNAEQVTLNLAQNEQVVLNLFNATASPTAQSSGVNLSA